MGLYLISSILDGLLLSHAIGVYLVSMNLFDGKITMPSARPPFSQESNSANCFGFLARNETSFVCVRFFSFDAI